MLRLRDLSIGAPALLLASVLLTACETLAPGTGKSEAAPADVALGAGGGGQERGSARDEVDEPSIEELERLATDAIEAGDYAAARDALDELAFRKDLADARASLEAGEPEDALVAIDRALSVHPKDQGALWVKAVGSEQLADKLIARGVGAQFVEGALGDALAGWLALPQSAESLTGASRAAMRMQRYVQALRTGRAAVEAAKQAPIEAAGPAHRAWAEAAYRGFIAQFLFNTTQDNASAPAGADLEGEDSDALFLEAEDALARLAGFTPDDAWVWTSLGDLYLWGSDSATAAASYLSGLDRLPDDMQLVERYRGALANQGADVLLSGMQALEQRHPQSAPTLFVLGRERLRAAVGTHKDAPAEARAAFVAAEAELARARGLDATLASQCLGWEVIARAGQGWCAYELSDLDAARASFLSMEELFEGGLAFRLGDELRSGIDGLWFIGDQYRQRGNWEAAAVAFETLASIQPEDANWANNAGFFCRDAAVEREALGRALCLVANGDAEQLASLSDPETMAALREAAGVLPELAGTEAEAVVFRAASERHLTAARDLAERSYRAYLEASRLAPEDVRIVNDTALVAVYYLHEDLDNARTLLERAIELGAAQLAADDALPEDQRLDEEARFALTEAWGDAYQNMGVLHLMHLGDPAGALPYLAESVRIGPVPRPLLTGALIPWCEGSLDVPLGKVMPEIHWCAPCGAATSEPR